MYFNPLFYSFIAIILLHMSYWETKCHFCTFKNPFIAPQGYLNCKKWLIKYGKKQTNKTFSSQSTKIHLPLHKMLYMKPKKVLFFNYPVLDFIFQCSSQCPSAVSMHSQLPFMRWSSSITLKAMPAFLAEVKCLKHKCRHIPGTSVLRDLFMLPAAGGLGGEWQLCKACGRQCSSSLCVEYYSPSEVLLCGRLLWVIAKLGSLLRDTKTEWEDYLVLLHRGCTPL